MSLPEPFGRPQPLPGDLAAALAKSGRRIGPFGREVLWFESVPSTNDVAAELARGGAPEGVVVVAGAQTAGRGRHGRAWWSPAGAGLYVSVLLRPPAHVVPLITLAAGVGLADGLRSAGLTPILKWPNDVHVGAAPGLPAGRKIAGILAEAAREPAGGTSVVLGCGVNVGAAACPPDLVGRATSIEAELSHPVEGPSVLVECLAGLAARYDDLVRDRVPALLDAWRSYARPLLGRGVEWEEAGLARRGTAEDIDASGALVVRTSAGPARVIAGEVRWI